MVSSFVFQVVGFQNSGKTTLVQSLIEKLSSEGIKVGTIKHHGHGGKPEVNERKDSAVHIQTGAHLSLVEGDGRLILQAEKTSWSLDEQISLLSSFQLDFILIEGHKYADYPKAVIIKQEKDLQLLRELTNVKAVFVWSEDLSNQLFPLFEVEFFQLNDLKGMEWLIHYLKNHIR
ncbi:molybdopterin-guanine dinucleotide biosynthesis protein B [Bacillus sp. CGMCC 1.16607]|uniref:molybdopterin-guanine dinucleotide biosynthesis protein B n=1 Tax=Bacillus sp. CGMCC 1.16607 TaxID=3351842 RepID=UPI003642B92F